MNSNPATIMTDPAFADRTYIEPLTPASVLSVLEREKPDAILPTLGGQTGLNVSVALAESGELDRLGVAPDRRVARGDPHGRGSQRVPARDARRRASTSRGRARAPRSTRRWRSASEIGFPVIVRRVVHARRRRERVRGSTAASSPRSRARGLAASPVGEILIEESIAGWKEFELEVMRDGADDAVIVCSIENVDPMGVHTGDSITVAPQMTLTDREYQRDARRRDRGAARDRRRDRRVERPVRGRSRDRTPGR